MSESPNSEESEADHGFSPKFTTEKGRPLMKEVVTGWIVTRYEGSTSPSILQKPLVAGVTDSAGDYATDRPQADLSEEETVINIIPAEPGTRMVYGLTDADWVKLGVEYPDASNPDWDSVLETKKKRRKSKRKRKQR